jgi:hypothetical protein
LPQQLDSAVENNFTKGLITESTGLNFPENAATDTDNCEFTLIGDVNRRQGIDYENNFNSLSVALPNNAICTYKWNNAGGDGLTQVVVEQIGSSLYFYLSSAATTSSPLSTHRLASVVPFSFFAANGGALDQTLECQFADGNGYLFVFHPNCDPFYCTYSSGVVTANVITVQIRDFIGIPEPGVPDNFRPLGLSNEHKYNLINQGWQAGAPWSTTSTTPNFITTGAETFTVGAGLGATAGQSITIYDTSTNIHYPPSISYMVGTVSSYSGTTMVVSISSFFQDFVYPNSSSSWSIVPTTTGYVNTWFTAIGNFPSNADVWWYFKDSTGVFNPATTQANTVLGSGAAPKGHNILNAFQQQRTAITSVPGITDVTTNVRPKTGCWFQGRVWYTGADASYPVQGDEPFSTWTENIYFSQIVTQGTSQFGRCYQQNDPTSDTLFDLLPTDGGVIQIQGCGSIYKLFPLMNALLVFAANGVWYITGSTGIGFAANDYTIVKLSSVQSISSTSFVDVLGLPIFWNEEGIYKVEPAKQGASLLSTPLHVNPLEVIPITLGTILNFYNQIPLSSKKNARGAYHPINYIVQWIYRDTEATDVTSKYQYNKILNYNNSNSAFFPYTISTGSGLPTVNSIIYVQGPGGSISPDPVFKYVANNNSNISFAEENDSTFVDWASVSPTNYTSYFITGYKLRGQAIKKFQPQYIQVYSRLDGNTCGYKIQGIWDYATSPNSGRFSSLQQVNYLGSSNYGTMFKRHKIRGSGYALQFKITSNDGMPFDIQGWAVVDTVNQAA